MATGSENLDVVVNLRGGREAAAQARQVEQAIGGIGTAAGRTASASGALAATTQRQGSAFAYTLARVIRYSGALFAVREGMNAITSGFRFDATMEQNTIAFTHFLGSAQAAKTELATLYDVAAKTPFTFADVTGATRKFLAFGFSVTEANQELAILGDAVAGIGGGSDEINRLILAIGQIRAKGKLQADELLQLTELGLVNTQDIAKQMGMTSDQFFKAVTAGQIKSEAAISAINAVLVAQFRGSAAEQSRSVIGQLSSIKDYGAQAMGLLVQPLFDLAKSDVLPSISGYLQQFSVYLKAGGAADIYHYLGLILKVLTPLIATLAVYKAAVVAVTVAEGIWAGIGVVVALWGTFAAVLALIPAVTGLADAWLLLDAATYGNPFVAVIAAVIAVIAALGYAYVKVGWFHDAVNALAGGLKWLFVDVIGRLVIGSIVRWAEIAWSALSKLWGLVKTIGGAIGRVGGAVGSIHLPGIHVPFMATGGTIPVGGAAIVGERGPELAVNRGNGTEIIPGGGPASSGGTRWLQGVVVQVDGRTLAEIVVDHGQTAAARA